MLEVTLVIFLLIAISLPCAWLYRFNKRLASRRIEKWAAGNGLTIVGLEYQSFKTRPFFLVVRDGDQIYRITARRHDNEVLTGWLRCNVALTGRYAGRVDVKWEQVRGFPVVMPDRDQAS